LNQASGFAHQSPQQKSADVRQKTVMLIYTYPGNITAAMLQLTTWFEYFSVASHTKKEIRKLNQIWMAKCGRNTLGITGTFKVFHPFV